MSLLNFVKVEQVDKHIIISRLYKNSFLRHLNKVFGTGIAKELPLFYFTNTSFFNKIYQLKTHYFYAPELYFTFDKLYKGTKAIAYKEICDSLIQNTWLKSMNLPPINADVSKLSDMSITFSDYQMNFIKNYFTNKQKYELRGYYNAFEQGLGKSLTAIGIALMIGDPSIVLCPKSLVNNWIGEIDKAFTPAYKEKANMKIGIVGESPVSRDYDYLICNYERCTQAIEYLQQGTTIIIDEAHNIRYMETRRAQDFLRLREACNSQNIVPMSGTPVKAMATEIIPMLVLLDPKFDKEAIAIFSNIYTKYRDYAYSVLRYRMSFVMDRQTKANLTLPPKIIKNVGFKVNDPKPFLIEQIKLDIRANAKKIFEEYNKDKDTYILYFYNCFSLFYDKGVISEQEMTIVQDLLVKFKSDPPAMLSDKENMAKFDNIYNKCYNWLNKNRYTKTRDKFRDAKNSTIGVYRRSLGKAMILYHQRRIDAIKAYATENKEEFIKLICDIDKKCILFTTKVEVVSWMSEFLNQNNVGNVMITGETKDVTAGVVPFRVQSDIHVLLATIQKLSTGITLTEANVVGFLDLPYRSAEFEQASDRAHRRGQDTTVYVYKMFIDTGEEHNITTHARDIMLWSAELSGEFIGEDKVGDEEDVSIPPPIPKERKIWN
jgi:SNF2 family DNA or RNA helicase